MVVDADNRHVVDRGAPAATPQGHHGPPMDDAGRLAVSLPCMACGYDLRTMRSVDRCPECGYAVAGSIHHSVLHLASLMWLRDVMSGAAVAGLLMPLVLLLLGLVAAGANADWVMELVGALSMPALLLGVMLPLIGGCVLCNPEPYGDEAEPPRVGPRWQLYAVVGTGAAIFGGAVLLLSLAGSFAGAVGGIVGAVCGAILLVVGYHTTGAAAGWCMASLCRRMSRPRLAWVLNGWAMAAAVLPGAFALGLVLALLPPYTAVWLLGVWFMAELGLFVLAPVMGLLFMAALRRTIHLAEQLQRDDVIPANGR